MTIIYGIKNCDTMKKAFTWLQQQGLDYQFHDYKKQPLSAELLDKFMAKLDWQDLINTRGTTWRKLPEEVRNNLDQASAKRIILENNSIVKRPLLVHQGQYHLGFKAEHYQAIFSQ